MQASSEDKQQPDLLTVVARDIALTMASTGMYAAAVKQETFSTHLPSRCGEFVKLPTTVSPTYYFSSRSFVIGSALKTQSDNLCLFNFLRVKHSLPEDKKAGLRDVDFPLQPIKFVEEEMDHPDFFRLLVANCTVVVREAMEVLMKCQYCPIRQTLVLRDPKLSVPVLHKIYSAIEKTASEMHEEAPAAAAGSAEEEQQQQPQPPLFSPAEEQAAGIQEEEAQQEEEELLE